MQSENTKSLLISTTKELLLTAKNPQKITARQIASQADVNLAMINYCFGSKDELLKLAIDEIIAFEFNQFSIVNKNNLNPKEKLKMLLYHVSEVTIQYESITRLSVPYVLLNAPIEIPYGILPYIKEHFGNQKEEQLCKMLAYEIISFMQVVFYRANDFYKYSGINLREPKELQRFIDNQLDLILGGETIEK